MCSSDLFEQARLRHNLATSGSGKITFHLGPSAVVMRTMPLDAYDFAYIDGNHSTVNVLEDAVHAFRLLKPDAIMAFDDYLWDYPDLNQEGRPKEAIDAFLDIYRDKIELLHRGLQVWLRKKQPHEIIHTPRPVLPSTAVPPPPVFVPPRLMSMFFPEWLLGWLNRPHPWLRPRTRWNALRQRFN